jgi:hypothetical protein
MSTILSSQGATARRAAAQSAQARREAQSPPAVWPVREPRVSSRVVAGRARSRALTPLLAFWLLVYTLLNAGDLMSTYVGLQAGLREANPLMSSLLVERGFGALIAYKLVVIVAVVAGATVLHRMHPRAAYITVAVCNSLVFLAVALNVGQMLLR